MKAKPLYKLVKGGFSIACYFTLTITILQQLIGQKDNESCKNQHSNTHSKMQVLQEVTMNDYVMNDQNHLHCTINTSAAIEPLQTYQHRKMLKYVYNSPPEKLIVPILSILLVAYDLHMDYMEQHKPMTLCVCMSAVGND